MVRWNSSRLATLAMFVRLFSPSLRLWASLTALIGVLVPPVITDDPVAFAADDGRPLPARPPDGMANALTSPKPNPIPTNSAVPFILLVMLSA